MDIFTETGGAMPDPRLVKLAEVLVNFSTQVKQGDWVHITAGRQAVPLAKEVMARVLGAGGRPSVNLECDELGEVYQKHASDDQLAWISPVDDLIIEQCDVWIIIEAPENTRVMSAIPPEKQQARNKAYTGWVETYMKRSASGKLRWVMTNYPCLALAQDAEMSLSDYQDFVFQATFCDQEDPIERWKELRKNQEKLVKWMDGKKKVEIKGANADVSFSIEGRPFINSFGDQNMPSGEVFTSPVEDSVQGWVRFSYPAVYLGREVEGVRVEFEGGKVIKASAEKNEDFLLAMLDTDDGARVLGEFGIGTNYGITRFTKDILYDEKIGGSFHLALGGGFPEAGGANQSSIHWDLITDARQDTEIRVDGALFYKDGEFKV
jgi:aminopeptidase